MCGLHVQRIPYQDERQRPRNTRPRLWRIILLCLTHSRGRPIDPLPRQASTQPCMLLQRPVWQHLMHVPHVSALPGSFGGTLSCPPFFLVLLHPRQSGHKTTQLIPSTLEVCHHHALQRIQNLAMCCAQTPLRDPITAFQVHPVATCTTWHQTVCFFAGHREHSVP